MEGVGRALVKEMFQGRETKGVHGVGVEGSDINIHHDVGRERRGDRLYYLKDLGFLEIIRSLSMPLPPNTIMTTVEFISLYINISHPNVSLPWNISLTNAILTPYHPLNSLSNLLMNKYFIAFKNHCSPYAFPECAHFDSGCETQKKGPF